MGTMNLSLSESLTAFVDEQAVNGGYPTSGEYVRDLIQREKDKQKLRALLLEGANSPIVGEIDQEFMDHLRAVARGGE